MRILALLSGVALGLLMASVPVHAHHSFSAEYSADRPLLLRGTVTKMEWVNPHAWLHVDVKGEDGTVESWLVELGAPNSLLRRGWTKNSLRVGTPVVIKAYGAKDGQNRANGRDVELGDGSKLFAGEPEQKQ